MYLLLFVFGGLLGAVGVVLASSGMSLRDGTFDAAILTPGMIAVAGGLLLIGLGGGLRTLGRIERILGSRPMPRALTNAEGPEPVESADTPDAPARIPFAPKAETQPAVAASDIFGAKSLGTPPVADKSPVIAIDAEHDAAARAQFSGKNGNGARAVRGLRLPARLRPASASERQSEPALDALWSKNPARAAEPAFAPIARGAAESNLTAANPENAAGVSVLKSGVVNGMPYTLYSDGSIEAQLPEGTLRFGSITDLRNHIEQSA